MINELLLSTLARQMQGKTNYREFNIGATDSTLNYSFRETTFKRV